MAVKNNVKRAYELMGMRVHLQVSHILTNMVGAASDVQQRRGELKESGMTPRDFIDRDYAGSADGPAFGSVRRSEPGDPCSEWLARPWFG